jgi:hypothetical protein
MPQLKPAMLIELNGKDKLLYRPNRNTDYKPASLYMELKLNYHLWLKLGGNAAIMCPNDSNIIDILQGKQTIANLGCPKIYTDTDERILVNIMFSSMTNCIVFIVCDDFA